ncbi:MAG: hypothetical protein JW728_01180 [Candidatus Aureabacteria bacterium]|nr:hypothetical protein [Candidatus Auribacterota bacterium]
MKTKAALLLIPLLLIAVFYPTRAGSFQNEPDAFRGIKWQASSGNIPGLQPVRKSGSDTLFAMENENLDFGSARLKIIVYVFSKNKFYAASLGFEGEENFEKIRSLLFYQHGKRANDDTEGYEYEWVGKDVIISLKYDPKKKFGYIDYIYRPIMINQTYEKAVK